MNKIEYKDFLAQYTGVYPPGYCQHLINEFERLTSSGAGSTRKQSEDIDKHFKDDVQLPLSMGHHLLLPFMDKNPIEGFFSGLQECFENYSSHYSILKNGNMKLSSIKYYYMIRRLENLLIKLRLIDYFQRQFSIFLLQIICLFWRGELYI